MRENLRQAGFFMLGIFSLLYVIFGSRFAEIHVQVSFLSFPVFVGEILLFICLVLSFFVFDFNSIKGWQWVMVFYFICVVLKALWGYGLWGPLALRHAALFYYPAFILFGFIFYSRAFLYKSIKLLTIFTILILCLTRYFHCVCRYWALTLWIIAFILARSFHRGTIKYIFYACLLLVIIFSYESLIINSRTFIIANIAAAVFLIAVLLSMARIKASYKTIIAATFFIALAMFVFKYSTLNAFVTVFDINDMIKRHGALEASIKPFRAHYIPQNFNGVKLFNPEQPSSFKTSTMIFNKEDKTNRRRVLKAIKKSPRPTEEKPEEKKVVPATRMVPEKPRVEAPKQAVVPAEKKPEEKPEEKKVVPAARMVPEKPRVEAPKQAVVPAEKKPEEKPEEKKVVPATRMVPEKPRVVPEKPRVEVPEKAGDLSDSDVEYVWVDEPITYERDVEIANNNISFRFFIWRDMIVEFSRHWPVLGFSFGKPFRSESLEILGWAAGEWQRDGWIEPHNSYLNILYRTGILGIALIGFLIWQFCYMLKSFVMFKSLPGLLLCSALINWSVAANFLPILELPYHAIPYWTLWGVMLGYLKELKG